MNDPLRGRGQGHVTNYDVAVCYVCVILQKYIAIGSPYIRHIHCYNVDWLK